MLCPGYHSPFFPTNLTGSYYLRALPLSYITEEQLLVVMAGVEHRVSSYMHGMM